MLFPEENVMIKSQVKQKPTYHIETIYANKEKQTEIISISVDLKS